jgi:methoxymalonate biosynthesis acyl carrier protein
MAMTQQSICSELGSFLAVKMGIEAPSPEADLVATGLLDSLAMVDLLVHLEERYDTRISLEDLDLDHLRSVARIAAFLAVHSGANEKPSA